MSLFLSLITIFLVILLGIVCCKKKIFSKVQIEGFELLLFKIIMPSYLFVATYTHDLSALLKMQYIASYLLTFGFLATIVAGIFARKLPMAAVYIRILASGYVNAAIYTLPVITILLKDPTAAIIGNIIQVILIQPIFIACLNVVQHKEKAMSKNVIDIITTPLIIMPIIGIGLNYLQINLPVPIVHAVTQIGSGASGIALFVFGLTLGATKITKGCLKSDLLSVVLAKNILHPLIALCVAYVMNLGSYWFSSLVIAASAPTAFSVYLISKQFSIEEEIVKKTITLSSVLSMASLILIGIIIAIV